MQRSICWWLLFFGLPWSVLADPVLTEAELLAALGPQAPAAKALAGELGEARARLVAARQLANPQLAASREDAGDEEEWTLGVAWMLPLDGRRSLQRDAATAGVAAAEHRVTAQLFALRTELRAIYAGWSLASQRRALLAEHLTLVEDLAAKLARQAEAGEASGLAAGRLELAALRARTDLEQAAATLGHQRAAILAWLEELPEGAVPQWPPLPEPLPDLDLSHRVDLEAQRRDIEQRRLEVRLARRFVAAPELEAGWKQIEAGGQTFDGPVFGLRWRVPLSERRQAEREAATAGLEVAEAQLTLAEQRARAELAAAGAAYADLRRAATATEPAKAQRLLVAATESYRLGETTITDLLDTLRALRDARLDHLDLYAAALAAHRALEAAAGRALDSGETP